MFRIVNFLKQAGLQTIDYISGAVRRIFAPRDDDYPATGVQPFEGDPAEK